MGFGHTTTWRPVHLMLIRSLVIVASLACLAGLLLAAQNPPFGLSNGPYCSLVGIAGLGLATLRSEGQRLSPVVPLMRSANRPVRGARLQAGLLAKR